MSPAKSSSIVYWLDNSLYLNVTNKCSNNCYFCIRHFRNGVGGFKLKLDKEPSIDEIISELQNVFNRKNWSEIVFCGFGEPTERLDCILTVAKWIRNHYGKIVTIRVNTNGQASLLNRECDIVGELKKAGVNKVSVSLNTHDKDSYNQICRPAFKNAFENVLRFIEEAKKQLDVEITAVALPEVDLAKIEEFAERMGVKFRRRDYIPCFW